MAAALLSPSLALAQPTAVIQDEAIDTSVEAPASRDDDASNSERLSAVEDASADAEANPARARSAAPEQTAEAALEAMAEAAANAETDLVDDRELVSGLNVPQPRDVREPLYPQQAYDEEVEADVFLDLELDAEGRVRNVDATRVVIYWYDDMANLVSETLPLDDDEWGFIPAAQQALRDAQWLPAIMVDAMSPEGRAIPVIVEQRVQFLWDNARLPLNDALDEENDEDEELSAHADDAFDTDHPSQYPLGEDPFLPVNYEGRVLERGTRRPLTGVLVSAYREPDGPRVDAVTDAQGRFALRGLPEGEWYVLIDEDGFRPLEAREQLRQDEAVVVTYRIERAYFDEYRSQTVEEPPAREVTRRSLETTEIQRIPGTNNDAIRVVQNLPGVARAPFSGGDIIVRGSEPNDSGVFIDGMPIPALYHFGALRAVIPTELVEQIDFYPGNFGVRFGRATAGVLDVETTMRQADQWGGHIDVNVFDTGLFLKGPLGDRVTLELGFRRSYIDALLLAVKNAIPINLTAAPRYYDYQARLVWDINDNNKASLMFFGSDDLIELVLQDEEDLDPGVRGGFRSSQSFHSVLLRLDTRLSDRVENTFRAIGGVQKVGIGAGDDFYLNLRLNQMALRDELKIQAKDNLDFRVGLDLQLTPARVALRLPRAPVEGQESLSFDALEVAQIEQNIFSVAPGVYAEADYRPIEGLQIIPGVRVDYFGVVNEWAADARLGLRYAVNDAWTVKGAVGNFHRAPDANEILRDFGNPDLGLEQAIQYSMGFEWKITDYLQFDVETFYKDMRSLVSPSDQLIDRAGVATPELFNNGGIGRVYGAEFFLRHQLANNFFGWLTYTIAKAERKDFGSNTWRRFDNDQTHILTLLGSYNLPKNWSVGGRFRLVSGNLYTPVIGATYDAGSGSYIRVTGPVNSERQPLFHQLDVRVDKRWVFPAWSLNLYLDIQNLYNRQNPEGNAYSYDFSQSARVSGLPFIPAFGIRGEF